MESDRDPWLGMDKLYHVLMCFSLTFLFYALASLTPYPYRRYTISIRSVLSLLAGAAKEAADHLGYFRSSGAFLRDALADILGVYIASFALSLFRSPPPPPHLHAFSLVWSHQSIFSYSLTHPPSLLQLLNKYTSFLIFLFHFSSILLLFLFFLSFRFFYFTNVLFSEYANMDSFPHPNSTCLLFQIFYIPCLLCKTELISANFSLGMYNNL